MTTLARTLDSLLATLRAALPQELRAGTAGNLLSEFAARMRSPLRVAIVGQIKVGKSTLMNALLGEALLPTGIQETTYNINWLHHGPQRKAVIRWLDGRPEESIDIDELETWTRRLGAPQSADEIRYLDVYSPNELLRQVEIIDTPGLKSSHQLDSKKTEAFLNLVENASDREASQADAVVYVFTRGMHESDEAALRAFRQATEGRVSPLNAVGVLAQADRYWPSTANPMEVGRQIVQNLKSKEQIRNSLFDVLPIAALPALGASIISNAERDALLTFSQLEDEIFRRLTTNAKRFLNQPEEECGVSFGSRERLYDIFGLYGVCRVRALVRELGIDAAIVQLRNESGIPELHRMLSMHFGRRALLIKSLFGLARVRQLAARMRDTGGLAERAAAELWSAKVDEFVINTPDVLRLEMLRSVYSFKGDISDKEFEEIQAVGEYSSESIISPQSYPGASSENFTVATVEQRVAYWRARANEAREMGSKSEFAARAMCRLLEFSLNDAANLRGGR